MKVSEFMVPAAEVATCLPSDTTRTALNDMVVKKIGAIVVVSSDNPKQAVGILTKTDFVEAYQKGMSLETPVSQIMSDKLETLLNNKSRDQAAEFFEQNKTHHAIVIDASNNFVGIISAWDVSSECAKDGKAWPWFRSPDGKFHKPSEKPPDSPTSVARHRRESHSFRDYIDSVRDLPFMDD